MNRYTLKRQLAAMSGVLQRKWNTISPGLYVFNYHRIGDPNITLYDPNVFSCDEEHFDSHIKTLTSRFQIIDINDLLELIRKGKPPNEPLALITFDDGYEDGYSMALPILESYNARAIFFLPTDFIGSNTIAWWDEVAWIIRKSTVPEIRLEGWPQSVTINHDDIKTTLRLILKFFKTQLDVSIPDKLDRLRLATNMEMERSDGKPMFLSWEQARSLVAKGMGIGSHTSSHQILSHLSIEDQREELLSSKKLIEKELGVDIHAIAYPVGERDAYTAETVKLARECGYSAAFTYIYGFNNNPELNPFELLRIPVEGNCDPIDIKYTTVFAPRI